MKTPIKISAIAVFAAFALFSCSKDTTNQRKTPDIPSDSKAGVAPEITAPTDTKIPNPTVYSEGTNKAVSINLSGIEVAPDQWLPLYGTGEANQNIWVEVDGKQKGIKVLGVDSGTKAPRASMPVDLVFLVDNSGSMAQESDAVANSLDAWAQDLASKGLDIRFGCIGYGHLGPNGGIDMGSLENMSNFLSNRGKTGRDRTIGFVGESASLLQTVAQYFQSTNNAECGMKALRMADFYLRFRFGANRIYVNLTDEPNQPENIADFSVDFVKEQANWNTNQGEIHTVYSASTFAHTPLKNEHPWLMSEYTGGTHLFASPTFTGVDLNDLPITGALLNSHRIRFMDNSGIADGEHTVKITIVDEGVQATKEFTNVKFGK